MTPKRFDPAAIPPGTPPRLAGLMREGRAGGAMGGHHRDVFYALAGLGHATLAELDVETDPVRQLRAASVYSPRTATAADVARIRALATRALPAIRAAILRTHPNLPIEPA